MAFKQLLSFLNLALYTWAFDTQIQRPIFSHVFKELAFITRVQEKSLTHFLRDSYSSIGIDFLFTFYIQHFRFKFSFRARLSLAQSLVYIVLNLSHLVRQFGVDAVSILHEVG